MRALCAQQSELRASATSALYARLGLFFDLRADQHWLESQPCAQCHSEDKPVRPRRLPELESETKYAHNYKASKLSGSQHIQAVHVKIGEVAAAATR